MVVHGPEAFDHGDVIRLSERLRPVRILVAGVMARTAAEESGLDLTWCGDPPSAVIRRLEGPAYLVNRGKNPHTGRIFGEIVAGRLYPRELMHLECSSRTLYLWNGSETECVRSLAAGTGFRVVPATGRPPVRSAQRAIRGCIPGEVVCINGVVIGRARSETVIVETVRGTVRPVCGLQPKAHGLEKLHRKGPVDLSTAWCKSGPIRTRGPVAGRIRKREGTIEVIDHCGQDIFSRIDEGTCGILAIGDDTTAVCGHICTHLGIPVLGIVDGDADQVIESGFTEGSVVVEVDQDDEVGRLLTPEVSMAKVEWEDWVEEMIQRVGSRVRVVHRF